MQHCSLQSNRIGLLHEICHANLHNNLLSNQQTDVNNTWPSCGDWMPNDTGKHELTVASKADLVLGLEGE